MQVGIELGGYWPSNGHHINNLFPEMLEVVKLGDTIGLDAFIIGEHHFMDYGATPAPLSIACHIAPITKAPRLIAAIVTLPMHDAPILAGEVALADHLTKGRLEIGVARGGAPYEYLRTCKPSDAESTRKIFEERLEALQLLFTQQDVSFNGAHTQFDNVTIMPPVLQQPHPPIWLTCIRPESSFHSAKNGFHVFLSSLRQPMSFVRGLVDAFRAGVAESKRPQGAQELALLQWVYVAKDDDDARAKLEMAYLKQQKFWRLLNNTSNFKGGRIPPVPMNDTIDDLAKGLVIGTKTFVEDRLLEIKDAGFNLLAMKTGFGASNADELASIERFAEFILPGLRSEATDATTTRYTDC